MVYSTPSRREKNCGHWWNGENWIGVELETPVSAPEVIETKVETVVQTPVEEPAPMEPTPIEPAPSNSKDRASQNDIEALLAGGPRQSSAMSHRK